MKRRKTGNIIADRNQQPLEASADSRFLPLLKRRKTAREGEAD